MDAESADIGLATDLYELTMAASYLALGMNGQATFSLFVRKLPNNRSFLVVAGLQEALRRLTELTFDSGAIEYLRSTGQVRQDALTVLSATRFRGDVWAAREGRIVFANEPILEITAPILEAQLAETAVLNAIHFPTLVATKAARCVAAAPGKTLVDFGLRRAPGIEASVVVARACWLAGFESTSNVLAGRRLGMPVAGTVAHSFIEAFPTEIEAFRAFAATFPGPVTLLVDTYDTSRGVDHAVCIAKELEASGRSVAAVRLDSGDLVALSRAARRALDAAGFHRVGIVASGGLDEYALDRITRAEAPIDAFGVGTRVGMSEDAPTLDMAYKIVEYEHQPCLKLSAGKETLIGAKQVWRRRGAQGLFQVDRIAARDEPTPGPEWEPLLEPVVVAGAVVRSPDFDDLRRRHREEIGGLPPRLFTLEGQAHYPVECSSLLSERQREATRAARTREGLEPPPD